jgi:hypothetical protein
MLKLLQIDSTQDERDNSGAHKQPQGEHPAPSHGGCHLAPPESVRSGDPQSGGTALAFANVAIVLDVKLFLHIRGRKAAWT